VTVFDNEGKDGSEPSEYRKNYAEEAKPTMLFELEDYTPPGQRGDGGEASGSGQRQQGGGEQQARSLRRQKPGAAKL